MIKLLILDIDGILTDGKKYYDKTGLAIYKTFCDKDWTSIKRFKAIGVDVMFLTGDPFNEQIAVRRNIPVIVNRKDGYHNDKGDYVDELCNQFNFTSNEVAYFGDDLFDVGIMKKVKYPFSLKDSPTMVKENSVVIDCNAGENAILYLYEYCESMNLIPKYSYEDIMDKIYELDKKEEF